ncbi:MAG: hypothetical protein JWO97_4458 [Acidobacteria bacterium]|nr:hypothetical protein [Acidobacteriota bacterium]
MLAACGRSQNATVVQASAAPRPAEEISFTAIESPSLAFLPRQQEASGWRLDEDPIVVPGNRLEAYFEKESAHFTKYEASDVTVGKYTSLGGDRFATVEIFRFPDFVKAFGAYSTRKNGTMRFLDIPNESFEKAHSIHVWRGPFYVRVTSDAGEGALTLVRFVADRMPAAPSKPAVFNFLPDKPRVAGSERYSAESGFGQPYLANSFQATFNIDGDLVDGLVIPAANKQAATQILNAYRNLYVRNGKLLDPIPNLGEDNFTAEDRYLGRAVAFRIDRFVIAFNGYRERQHLVDLAATTDQRILGTIRKQLVTAEKRDEDGGKTRDESVPAWVRP